MILTDEIVEKGARGMEAQLRSKGFLVYEDAARACLLASLPEILEECAKVAEERFPYREVAKNAPSIASAAAAHIAITIRNLKPKEEGNG